MSDALALLAKLAGNKPIRMSAHKLEKDQSRGLGMNSDMHRETPSEAQSLVEMQDKTDKLKIVLVEDESLFRRGLSELLTHCYDFVVLGAVGTVEELRALMREQPDLLVMDLRMKPMDGLTMLVQIRAEGFTTPAVMLTMSDSEEDLARAIRAGARGYLLKDMAPEEVVDAIHRVAAGELVVAPAMTMKMIEILRGDQPEHVVKNTLHLLTKREREILQLLSRGESNKSIALSLHISYDTVKQHVRHILNKLNLSSRVKAAVLFAKEQQASDDENSTLPYK
jgi:two-component system, NarL family, nitrate/nitrite response regulator NarL